jgi:hypothetical protein
VPRTVNLERRKEKESIADLICEDDPKNLRVLIIEILLCDGTIGQNQKV